jgi:hypothetical protein
MALAVGKRSPRMKSRLDKRMLLPSLPGLWPDGYFSLTSQVVGYFLSSLRRLYDMLGC